MKIKNIILTLAASSAIFAFGSQTNSVSAATWHKGTPKEIRGDFYVDYGKKANIAFAEYKIGSKYSANYLSNRTALLGKNVRYQKLGKNVYKLKYDAPAVGMIINGKGMSDVITKVGNNIKVKGYDGTYKNQHKSVKQVDSSLNKLNKIDEQQIKAKNK